jgi:hypothetical protein
MSVYLVDNTAPSSQLLALIPEVASFEPDVIKSGSPRSSMRMMKADETLAVALREVNFKQINQLANPNSLQAVSSITSSVNASAYDIEISEATRYYFEHVGLRSGSRYKEKFEFSNGLTFWTSDNYTVSLQKGDKVQVSFENNGNIARVSTITGNTYYFRKINPNTFSYMHRR